MAEATKRPQSLPETILHNFQSLTMPQRIGLVVVLALGIAVIPVLALMGKDPEMGVLFSKLEREDVQAIVSKLDRQGIPYRVSESGEKIEVPAEKVHELRLQMASDGLPEAGGVGFEIFDRTGLGVTQFVQKMNYRRALQGELARTISQIREVERTRVHLVLPERRLFTSDQQPAQAAVVLTLKRGAALTQGQVQGVMHLVSSSVEGLDPADVTIVDNHGQVLSSSTAQKDSPLTTSQVEMQRDVEQDLERRVQTMLDQVLGRNKSVVRVTTELDFRQVEVTEETYDPESQVVRSENRSQEKVVEENGPVESGIPGVRSNVPNDGDVTVDNGRPKEAKRKNETLNYELNRKVSKVVEATGSIKRLSVAVLVDGTYTAGEGAETATSGDNADLKYVPRSEEEMGKLVDIVKKAVGFSEARGDEIEVVNTPFEATSVKEGDEHISTVVHSFLATWGGVIKPAVFLLLGLLVLLFVVRPMVTSLITPPPEPVQIPQDGLPVTVADYEAEISESPEESAIKLAADNPTTAAQVIRTWIKGEQEEKMEKV
ncbi:MAG: flagellar M-ring protein FliF [Nitrospirales bacterium]|nr:flagellar M-ring protein FliF [Nitrospira sp.]MDR4502272.1 flagellar M-ring protein FliF [Nitrospirales bacterium]